MHNEFTAIVERDSEARIAASVYGAMSEAIGALTRQTRTLTKAAPKQIIERSF